MTYRCTQQEARERYLANYDAEGASRYNTWVNEMTPMDHDACVADLKRHVTFSDNMSVLDAGSGTGALCLSLIRIPGLRITALEPSLGMMDLLQARPELQVVATTQGFCDHPDDQFHFGEETFDLVASRQLVNCLYDPLSAFQNWYHWLRKGGMVVVMDGLFDRDAWTGEWDGFVDMLPFSACRTMATVPYLLEKTGFSINHVGLMVHTNALPSTQTQRYMVVATKPKK